MWLCRNYNFKFFYYFFLCLFFCYRNEKELLSNFTIWNTKWTNSENKNGTKFIWLKFNKFRHIKNVMEKDSVRFLQQLLPKNFPSEGILSWGKKYYRMNKNLTNLWIFTDKFWAIFHSGKSFLSKFWALMYDFWCHLFQPGNY